MSTAPEPKDTAPENAHPPAGTHMRLDTFDPAKGLNRGRGRATELAWYVLKCCFFLSPLPWPGRFKVWLLRCFGAQVGEGAVIKPRVNIHLPWKLVMGDHVWLGEEVFILNFEPVRIGSHVCISQRAFLCTGNHDYRKSDFPYRNAPITIQDGAWVGAQVFLAPGTTIEREAVLAAGAVAGGTVKAAQIHAGNPARPVRERWPEG